MKKLILLLSIVISFNSFAGDTEEQRKYVFNGDTSKFEAFMSGGVLDGLSSKNHSEYTYTDIYIDTENLDLYKNNLSLRLRKRDYGDGTTEYGIQLKSEMLNHGDIRMEVEEDELNFYQVVHEGQVYSLQKTIDAMIAQFLKVSENATRSTVLTQDSEMNVLNERLLSWLRFKVNAAIGPFQKLNRLLKDKANLATIRPMLIGMSKRSRSHIIIDKKNTTEDLVNIAQNSRSSADIPSDIAQEHLVWVMETSLDSAKFYSLYNKYAHKVEATIHEYEVENKYRPDEVGTKIMNKFESSLIRSFKAQSNLESKYRQSMNHFIK